MIAARLSAAAALVRPTPATDRRLSEARSSATIQILVTELPIITAAVGLLVGLLPIIVRLVGSLRARASKEVTVVMHGGERKIDLRLDDPDSAARAVEALSDDRQEGTTGRESAGEGDSRG
jgi:hypothetical protein